MRLCLFIAIVLGFIQLVDHLRMGGKHSVNKAGWQQHSKKSNHRLADDEKRLARNIKDVEKHTPKQNSRTIFGFFKKWCNELENGGGGLVWKLKKVLSKMLFDRVDKCCRDMGYRPSERTLMNAAGCRESVKSAREKAFGSPKIQRLYKRANERNHRGKRSAIDMQAYFLRRIKRLSMPGKRKLRGLGRFAKEARKLQKEGYGMHVMHIVIDLQEHQRNFHTRRKKRGLGEGIATGFLLVAGIWLGYMALVCFISILFPPFIFAIFGTVIFGAGAWFCLKAAEAVLDASVERQYDGDFTGEDYENWDDAGYEDYDTGGFGAGDALHTGGRGRMS